MRCCFFLSSSLHWSPQLACYTLYCIHSILYIIQCIVCFETSNNHLQWLEPINFIPPKFWFCLLRFCFVSLLHWFVWPRRTAIGGGEPHGRHTAYMTVFLLFFLVRYTCLLGSPINQTHRPYTFTLCMWIFNGIRKVPTIAQRTYNISLMWSAYMRRRVYRTIVIHVDFWAKTQRNEISAFDCN